MRSRSSSGGIVAQTCQRFADVQIGDVVRGVLLRIGEDRAQPRRVF